MFRNKSYLGLIFIFLMMSPFILRAQESTEGDQVVLKRRKTQVVAMMGSWREVSTLRRTDGIEYKINTLNSVGRFGFVNYFKKGRLFAHYGLMLGQSENEGAVDNNRYFQRSVFFAGIEGALDWCLSPLALILNISVPKFF